MRGAIKRFVERRLTVVLVLAIAVALLVPGLAAVPTAVVPICVATLIFLSCFRVEPSEMQCVPLAPAVAFYVARFVVLPVVLFFAAQQIAPEFAASVLLLALMPAGVASPAFAGLFGGNLPLALTLVVLSSLLTPLLVPVSLGLFAGAHVEINQWELFSMLCLLVFLPIVLHLPLRKNVAVRQSINRNFNFWSVLLVATLVLLVVAKERDAFVLQWRDVLAMLPLLSGEMALLYAFGWLAPRRAGMRERVTFCLCSGANNNSLGISLAFLYLTPSDSLFMVTSELPWVLALVPVKAWIGGSRRPPSAEGVAEGAKGSPGPCPSR